MCVPVLLGELSAGTLRVTALMGEASAGARRLQSLTKAMMEGPWTEASLNIAGAVQDTIDFPFIAGTLGCSSTMNTIHLSPHPDWCSARSAD